MRTAQEASLNSCPLQRKMTGVHLTHRKGIFHCQEHPTGQRRKTRARGQLQAGEDSKVNQGAQSRVKCLPSNGGDSIRDLKPRFPSLGDNRGSILPDKGMEE